MAFSLLGKLEINPSLTSDEYMAVATRNDSKLNSLAHLFSSNINHKTVAFTCVETMKNLKETMKNQRKYKKTAINLMTTAVVTSAILTSQSSYAESIYSEDFRGAVGLGDQPVSHAGWTGYKNDGESVWLTGPEPADSNVTLSNAGYLYAGPLGAASIEGSLLLYTEAGPFGSASTEYTFGEIDTLNFTLRNQDTTEDLKFAIRVGSDWFVSTQNFNVTASREDTVGSLDTGLATWNSLTIIPGTELTMGGSAAISDSDFVTAVGFFDESYTNRIRILSYDVTSIPEPGTTALFFGAFIGLCAITRRRVSSNG